MKKKLAGLVAAMMVLAVGTTAFASPQSGVQGATATIGGQEVTVSISDGIPPQYTKEGCSEEAAKKAAAEIANVTQASLLDVVNVFVAGVDAEHPATITFDIPAASKGDRIAVLHWNGKKWETIQVVTVATDGKVTATFTSLSPVAFAKITEKAPKEEDDPGFPKGGEAAPILPILAIVCLAGVVVCGKKVKFNA